MKKWKEFVFKKRTTIRFTLNKSKSANNQQKSYNTINNISPSYNTKSFTRSKIRGPQIVG